MDIDIISAIREKEQKTEIEWTLLKYNSCLSLISEILVEESKMHYTSEDAISEIRKCLQENT